MYISKITFARLHSLPGFNNEKLEIEVVLNPSEDAMQAVQRARQFVERQLAIPPKQTEFCSQDSIPF